jgi:hypothetical protein
MYLFRPKGIWFVVIISVCLTAVIPLPLDLTGSGTAYTTEKPLFSEDEILYELNSERNLIHYTRLNGLLIDFLRERKRIFAKDEGVKENNIFVNAEELINEASMLASQERYDESFRLLENVFNLIK